MLLKTEWTKQGFIDEGMQVIAGYIGYVGRYSGTATKTGWFCNGGRMGHSGN